MSAPSVSFAPVPPVLSKHFDAGKDPTFAFARLQGDICLVQRGSPGPPFFVIHLNDLFFGHS